MMAKQFRIWVGSPTVSWDGGGGGGRGYESGAFWGTDLDRNEFIWRFTIW